MFGPFFSDVQACLEMMKQTQVVASGSAVFGALEDNAQLKSKCLALFVQSNVHNPMCVWRCHEFLDSEGYRIDEKCDEDKEDEVCLFGKLIRKSDCIVQ